MGSVHGRVGAESAEAERPRPSGLSLDAGAHGPGRDAGSTDHQQRRDEQQHPSPVRSREG